MADPALAHCLALARAARMLEGDALAHMLARLEAALEQAGDNGAAQPALADAVDPACAQSDAAHPEPGHPEAAFTLDPAGYLTAWNDGASAMFGYTAAEALGQHVLFLYAADDDDTGIAELFLAQDGGADGAGGTTRAVRRRKKDGDMAWVRLALAPLVDDAGDAAGMLVRMAPLGAPPHAQACRQIDEQDRAGLHALIVEQSDQGVLITDAQECIVAINPAFTRITGYAPADAIGNTLELLLPGTDEAGLRARVRAAMRGHGPWRGEIAGKRKNGELFPQSVTIGAMRDAHGRVTHAYSLFADISAHKDAQARMERMASYDSLTGLPNRSLLNHLVDQTLVEARRANHYGALMVIEVNRIGAISDTLGHDVASDLLCEIGRLFRLALRGADILARIDGSKFAVALPQIEKREHAAIVAQKLSGTLAGPIVIGAHSLQVGATIGIAVYPEDSMDTASLIRLADVAMAKAGQGGADSFLFYREEMDQRAKEHLRLETELRVALAGRELELHYQPKVSLRSGRIVGAEALIRWHHPQRGMISPGVFIPLAEETGLILELGGWVLDEACRQVRAWKDAGLSMPPIAINLSARQFERRLPARILEVLDRHRVLPEQIVLEITESLLVGGSENVIAIMNELVAMGLVLALDDFGTGYSSLAYLKKFPISTLKIDRAFVIGLPHEENDCAIARAIVTMAQQLRQEIVAEGVETVEQMAFLRDLGCDQLQGYLFSPAVSAAEFARMMRDGVRLAVGRT